MTMPKGDNQDAPDGQLYEQYVIAFENISKRLKICQIKTNSGNYQKNLKTLK